MKMLHRVGSTLNQLIMHNELLTIRVVQSYLITYLNLHLQSYEFLVLFSLIWSVSFDLQIVGTTEISGKFKMVVV